MTFQFKCEFCGLPKAADEMACFESDECTDCHDARLAREWAYWKPLYDGEVRAGLHAGVTMAEARKLKGMEV